MIITELARQWKLLTTSDEYTKFKRFVRKRYNYTCATCSSKKSRANRLHVHHIFPKAIQLDLALNASNGKLLCAKCHRKVHAELSLEGTFKGLPKVTVTQLKKLTSTLTHTPRKRYRRRKK